MLTKVCDLPSPCAVKRGGCGKQWSLALLSQVLLICSYLWGWLSIKAASLSLTHSHKHTGFRFLTHLRRMGASKGASLLYLKARLKDQYVARDSEHPSPWIITFYFHFLPSLYPLCLTFAAPFFQLKAWLHSFPVMPSVTGIGIRKRESKGASWYFPVALVCAEKHPANEDSSLI